MILSPGKWHLEVPRDIDDNIAVRAAVLAEARTDRAFRKLLLHHCKHDILFYINLFVFQFNPSKRGDDAVLPFITYEFQDRAILATPETHAKFRPYDRGILWCYENDRTMACEKSRWQGASWLFLIVQDWLCLFHEYVQTLNISRNENAVDDGTKDSLFWKLRYMHSRLPDWMTGEIEESKLYFHFHKTDSEATGTASTAKAGVGGRASVIFVDEFPEIEKAQEVREKTAMTANCRFFNGTHLGVGTPFHRMCDPRQSPEIVRWRMHWTDHPEQNVGMYEFDAAHPETPILYDKKFKYPDGFQFVLDGSPTGGPRPGVRSPWYDRKSVEIGDSRAVAMNLDISPEGAAKQFFDGLKIRNIITESARPPLWTGELVHDKRGKLEGIRSDPNGRLRLWVQPKADGKLPVARYTLGADVATGQAGRGSTASCAAGIDADRGMKVLEFKDARLFPAEFAQVVVAICWFMPCYDGSGAFLIWDSSGPTGGLFENEVLALGYRNIYYNDEDLVQLSGSRVRRPGWFGSPKQKYAMLSDLRQALYDRVLIDRSEECLLEMLLFEYDQKTRTISHAGEIRTNDPSGAGLNHSDMAIASGLGWKPAKEMGEGGRKSPAKASGTFEPGTLGWLLALEEGRRRQLEEA